MMAMENTMESKKYHFAALKEIEEIREEIKNCRDENKRSEMLAILSTLIWANKLTYPDYEWN